MKPLSKRTKIVATLGPASKSPEMVRDLVRAGVNVFRLNCSHASHELLEEMVTTVRKVARAENASIGILADLQGPKIRVGKLKDQKPIFLKADDALTITTRPGYVGEAPDPGEVACVGTGYSALSKDVKAGEIILLDDGNIELRVVKVKGTEVHTVVLHGGLLKQHKGINLPGSKVSAAAMSKKDVADLKRAVELKVDLVALSFVRTGKEVVSLRKRIEKLGGEAKIIAKIERPEAIANIEEIIEESFGVMVARGDMGVELGAERVPALQKRIINLTLAAGKPVITATQMLESMVTNPRPTRAEASDVANAIYDGSSAVMLSAETASGEYPIRAVEIMASIARRTEADIEGRSDFFPGRDAVVGGWPRPAAVPIATVRAASYGALEAGAKLLCVFTESGTTARAMAAERISTPIIAFTPHEETRQRLALSWGVEPYKIRRARGAEDMLMEAGNILRHEKLAKSGDRVVAVFGTSPRSGASNTMVILTL